MDEHFPIAPPFSCAALSRVGPVLVSLQRKILRRGSTRRLMSMQPVGYTARCSTDFPVGVAVWPADIDDD